MPVTFRTKTFGKMGDPACVPPLPLQQRGYTVAAIRDIPVRMTSTLDQPMGKCQNKRETSAG